MQRRASYSLAYFDPDLETNNSCARKEFGQAHCRWAHLEGCMSRLTTNQRGLRIRNPHRRFRSVGSWLRHPMLRIMGMAALSSGRLGE